jgi:hypothetical protein
MPLDPRNVPTTSDAKSAQRIADLERRVAALERATRAVAQSGAPSSPTSTTTTSKGGTRILVKAGQPSGGTSVVDSSGNRAYFWTGSSWRSVAIT